MEILAKLNVAYGWLIALSKESPVIAGVLSLWGLSVLTFVLRNVPFSIFSFIRRQVTTSVVLNSQDTVYYEFLKWLSEHKIHSFIRAFNVSGSSCYGGGTTFFTYGYGTSFFFMGWRLVIVTRYKVDANATAAAKEVIGLTIMGRDRKVFEQLFQTIKKDQEDDTVYTAHEYKDDRWYPVMQIPKRPLDTVTLPRKTKEVILTHIKNFTERKDWYLKNGITYKTGILLYGPPGTGKTSLVSSLCSEYERDCFLINLSTLGDAALKRAMTSVPTNGIVLIEDIDTFFGKRKSRKVIEDREVTPGAQTIGEPSSEDSPLAILTLAGLLNALDGIACGTDRIVIATTNYIEKLDAALLREGRFDLKVELNYMTDEMLREYIKRLYPTISVDELENWTVKPNIIPCAVQQLVFENQNDPFSVLYKIGVRQETPVMAKPRYEL